ncbi:hypothetical protein LIER_32334 [Lithospermum erythrorhizon]|uniref:Uncharacterized protein n=1 Tax=Lithospermum erythrorhizon TaxID=34254 RepID=A0AAV3RTJ8_LITER
MDADNEKLNIGITPDFHPKLEVKLKGLRTTRTGSNLEISTSQYFRSVFSLATSLMEIIFIGLRLAYNKQLHSIFLMTDGLFLQVWFNIYKNLMADEGWRQDMEIGLDEVCNILWYPTDLGCFKNIEDINLKTVV